MIPIIYASTEWSLFKSAYNKCIKKLLGFARRDSIAGIFMYLSLPTADTIVYHRLLRQKAAKYHIRTQKYTKLH